MPTRPELDRRRIPDASRLGPTALPLQGGCHAPRCLCGRTRTASPCPCLATVATFAFAADCLVGWP